MEVRHDWIISQIGARQHYGVPRGFEATGQLKRLFTDAWCPRPLRILKFGTSSMRAFASRWHPQLPPHKVVSYNIRAIRDAAHHASHKEWTVEERHLDYLRIGEEFDKSVAAHLARRGQVRRGRDAFFGFNTGSLHTLRAARDLGVATVLDQIDPAKVEEELIAEESVKWPGWERFRGRAPQAYWDHMADEWAAADLVLVNSKWSKAALVKQGVPAEKLVVVPVAYEPTGGPVPFRRRPDGPLTVLWLGSVILRKGIQYLIEAAKLLKETELKFVIAGPVGISQDAVATAPPNMTFLGRVTRDRTDQLYSQADLFVLPTLSDGFAVTQVEAMSKGLPVVTTPNCGEVVTDGLDGLVVPAGDSKALADAILRLDSERTLLVEMAHRAFLRSTQFLLPVQARQVQAAVNALHAGVVPDVALAEQAASFIAGGTGR